MPTTTNYGWTTPADTDLVKDGASAIRTLGTAIDTTVFNNASAAIAKTIVDAKGDLIAATAADTVARLAVGANDTVLTADSSTATGLKWATPAASGGMTLISETVASANSSISLSSIPGTYKQLLLVWHGIKHSTTGSSFALRLNNDSGYNYKQGVTGFDGTSVNSRTDNENTMFSYNTAGYLNIFGKSSNGSNEEYAAKGTILIDNYASTTKLKYYNYHFSFFDNSAFLQNTGISTGTYNSTSAITSIDILRVSGTATITNNTNTSIRLYGIS